MWKWSSCQWIRQNHPGLVHNLFLILHAHELHTGETLNTWNLFPVPIHLPSHSYVKGQTRLGIRYCWRGGERKEEYAQGNSLDSCRFTWKIWYWDKAKGVLPKQTDGLVFHCGLYSQFPSEAFHMNEVKGQTVKVGQGEVKSCNQL